MNSSVFPSVGLSVLFVTREEHGVCFIDTVFERLSSWPGRIVDGLGRLFSLWQSFHIHMVLYFDPLACLTQKLLHLSTELREKKCRSLKQPE